MAKMAVSGDRKLYIGPRLRRLRRQINLTQARMAEDLKISASYLNLMERNQRPISAQVLLRIAESYDIELKHLASDAEERALLALKETVSDPLFAGGGPSNQELEEAATSSPAVADAMALLYRAYRGAVTNNEMLAQRLADRDLGGMADGNGQPLEQVREFIITRNNHFAELDERAETLAEEMGLSRDEPYLVLRSALEKSHGVETRVMPAEFMTGALRRYDRHRQTIFLSELLDLPGRCFQLAYQAAYLEQAKTLRELVDGSGLPDDESRGLARVALANYFAAALLMPYTAFLRTAEETGYDLRRLGIRFGTSFEQVAHRLTTLQRAGAKGIPFFLIRVDKAGNISKRFSAAGFHFVRLGGTCPRWNIHDAFRVPGQINTQIIAMEDGTRYFTLARTVGQLAGLPRPLSGISGGLAEDHYVVGIGCEIAHARRLVYSTGWNLDDERAAMPVGVNCRLCERADCAQRAVPPLTRRLKIDEHVRGISPFGVPAMN